VKFSKIQRRKDAEERQTKRNKRSAAEQIAQLDERLGDGLGAEKEREKLKKRS